MLKFLKIIDFCHGRIDKIDQVNQKYLSLKDFIEVK